MAAYALPRVNGCAIYVLLNHSYGIQRSKAVSQVCNELAEILPALWPQRFEVNVEIVLKIGCCSGYPFSRIRLKSLCMTRKYPSNCLSSLGGYTRLLVLKKTL